MNPCRCGYLGDAGARMRPRAALRRGLPGAALAARCSTAWTCTIEVMPIAAAELSRAPPGETSAVVAARVQAARDAQRAR